MIRPKIGLDWDDVTAPFNSIACELANEKYNITPALTIEDITSWANTGRASVIKEFYVEDALYEEQSKRISEETKENVRTLMEIADVYFITAVAPDFMGVRAKQIREAFPELSCDRIILGAAKNLVQFDMILDDNICNVLNSPATFPVLFRKPWNSTMTGLLSVNNMGDFVSLVQHILHVQTEKKEDMTTPRVIALVGPSGSGKNCTADMLCRLSSKYERPFSFTNSYSDDNTSKRQTVVSNEFFKENDFLETTMYAGKKYGTRKKEIETILQSGMNAVIPLDMCGAIAMKRVFPTTIIYLKRDKISIITNIVSDTSISEDEKVLRILSLEAEKKNAQICDYVIEVKEAAEKINSLFGDQEENR